MPLCHCDGPPHPYDPSWCINPKFDGGYIPRNHGGLGQSPGRVPINIVQGTYFLGTEPLPTDEHERTIALRYYELGYQEGRRQ